MKAKKGKNPAVVFDVDDTLLWSYNLLDAGSGFAGDPALRATWVEKKKFPAVPAMAKMVRKAKKGGCVVIAITERPASEAGQTRKNVNKRYDYAFGKDELLHLRPTRRRRGRRSSPTASCASSGTSATSPAT